MSLIQIEKLSLELGGKTILHEVGFSLEEGRFLLLIGPNGAGKSSLLKCLMGLHRDFSGRITIDGRCPAQLSGQERARLIGYVPQLLDLQFNLDVRSFMELSRYAHDFESPALRDAIIRRCMVQTETDHLLDHSIDQLSGGERQRVLLAAALAQEPRILVLDEPDQSLDPGHRVEMVRLLEQLYRETSLTILMVSHEWNPWVGFSPQILALKAGRVSFTSSIEQLDEHLSDLFGCTFESFSLNGRTYHVPGYR